MCNIQEGQVRHLREGVRNVSLGPGAQHWECVGSSCSIPSESHFSVLPPLWSAEMKYHAVSGAETCVPPDFRRPFKDSDHNFARSLFFWQDKQGLQGYEVDENAFPMGKHKWIALWIFSWGKCGVWEAKQLMAPVSSRDQFPVHRIACFRKISQQHFSLLVCGW